MLEIDKDIWTPYEKRYHLCYYIPEKHGTDTTHLSKLVLDFKSNIPAIVDKWIDKIKAQTELTRLNIKYVVRALSSNEIDTTNVNAPLHKLSEALSSHLDAEFLTELLHKTQTTEKFSTSVSVASERAKIIREVYEIKEIGKILGGGILFIDDIRTSGATADGIMKKIKQKHPLLVAYHLFLAQTSHDPNANEFLIKPKQSI